MAEAEKVGIIADIENLVYSAERDRLPTSAYLIADEIAVFLKKIGSSYGSISCMFGAIALPIGNRKKEEKVFDITKAFVRHGFHVPLVPFGPEAADTVLALWANRYVKDFRFRTIILGTGDGKGELGLLLEKLLAKRRNVHVVAYDRILPRIERKKVQCSLVAPILRNRFIRNIPAPSSEPITSGIVHEKNTFEDPYRAAIERIHTPTESPLTSTEEAQIRSVIKIMQTEIAHKSVLKNMGFGELTEFIRTQLRENGFEVDENNVKHLVNNLFRFTDIFERSDRYRLREKSEFLRKAKASPV